MVLAKRKLPAYPVYLMMCGAFSLCFHMIVTVNLVYQATVAGLNPLQLVLVGTTVEAVIFLCEVPTGVVADVYSRRVSVIIGMVLIGAGFVLEGSIPRFATILLAQVVLGVGWTFTSGAEQAWVADELGAAQAGRAYLRGAQVSQAGALAGTCASVGLASVRITLPIVLGGMLFIALGIFLALAMPERGFTPTPRGERTSYRAMVQTLRDGLHLVRQRPVLLTILGTGVFYGMFTEGFDRLWTAHLLTRFPFPVLGGFKPVVWFGIINAVGMLLTMAVTEIARRRVDTNSHGAVARTLLAITASLIAGVVGFGLAGHFGLAVAALWVISPLRSLHDPLSTAWINQRLDSRVRATVISMRGQVDAFGQIAGGPILGAVATARSIPTAMVAASIALLPALLLYARTITDGTERNRHVHMDPSISRGG